MSNQKEETRDYINGKLDGLNILMIYAKDGKSIRVEEVQQEIDHVMNTPVKKEEPVSKQATINIELKQANEALSQFNVAVERANMLAKSLKVAIEEIPIFKPEVEFIISGEPEIKTDHATA